MGEINNVRSMPVMSYPATAGPSAHSRSVGGRVQRVSNSTAKLATGRTKKTNSDDVMDKIKVTLQSAPRAGGRSSSGTGSEGGNHASSRQAFNQIPSGEAFRHTTAEAAVQFAYADNPTVLSVIESNAAARATIESIAMLYMQAKESLVEGEAGEQQTVKLAQLESIMQKISLFIAKDGAGEKSVLGEGTEVNIEKFNQFKALKNQLALFTERTAGTSFNKGVSQAVADHLRDIPNLDATRIEAFFRDPAKYELNAMIETNSGTHNADAFTRFQQRFGLETTLLDLLKYDDQAGPTPTASADTAPPQAENRNSGGNTYHIVNNFYDSHDRVDSHNVTLTYAPQLSSTFTAPASSVPQNDTRNTAPGNETGGGPRDVNAQSDATTALHSQQQSTLMAPPGGASQANLVKEAAAPLVTVHSPELKKPSEIVMTPTASRTAPPKIQPDAPSVRGFVPTAASFSGLPRSGQAGLYSSTTFKGSAGSATYLGEFNGPTNKQDATLRNLFQNMFPDSPVQSQPQRASSSAPAPDALTSNEATRENLTRNSTPINNTRSSGMGRTMQQVLTADTATRLASATSSVDSLRPIKSSFSGQGSYLDSSRKMMVGSTGSATHLGYFDGPTHRQNVTKQVHAKPQKPQVNHVVRDNNQSENREAVKSAARPNAKPEGV
ncbi:hypothetical protein [unidentified bacterial endosymbiont]|uniref:hypothetical protein n=1 Tax=unidentified bacterial endosymbiont TaxID=2355 RepID=UPI00209C9BD2|nr:hypothetical protein [unidentified bacterial endosymbiont]